MKIRIPHILSALLCAVAFAQASVLGSTTTLATLTTPATPATPGLAWGLGGTAYAMPVTSPKTIAGNITAVSTGGVDTLFIKTDGTLWAMGANFNGQLGNGTTSFVATTTPVQVASNVASVSAGTSHTMFIKTDGTLWGMGANSSGQLGDGTTTDQATPVQIASGVVAVSTGDSHTLFIKSDATLWGMGYGYNGQLGTGQSDYFISTPVQIASGVVSVSAGGQHTMFIKNDGTLWGMGANAYGQIGNGTNGDLLVPTQLATGIARVTCSTSDTFFIKTDGTLWGTGANFSGELGDGTISSRSTPIQIASGVTSVACGGSHTLFFKTDGTLWGMGYNGNGQLANGSVSTSAEMIPMQVAGGVAAVSAGNGHTMLLMPDKTLRAVGDNSYGQLGDQQPAPGPALVAQDVTDIAADTAYNNLFVKSDGTLWQNQMTGQIISQVAGVSGVAQAITGAYGQQRFYLKSDGSLWKLATDGTSSQVATDVASAGAGLYYFVYLKTDGTLWGVGGDYWSIQFGDGVTPWQIADHVVSVSTAGWHLLYVKDNQTLWGMGTVWGGFVPNTNDWLQLVFAPAQLETGVIAAFAHPYQNQYITTDGTLWTRGNGWSLYTGPAVSVDSGVMQVTGNASGSLYLKADGILYNRAGFLGTLGPVTTVAANTLAVSGGPDSWALYLQRKGVGTAPAITTQPQSATVPVGTAATLQVAATGSGPIGYQWFKDGNAILWGHSTQLVIPYMTAADAGSYTVEITNSAGAVTSSTASLQLPPPPVITSALTASGTYGQPFSYTITATNQPDDFDALSLPTGLSINHSTGVISGLPGAAGVFQVTIAASSGNGSSVKQLKLSIAQAKATISLSNMLQIYDGTPKSVTVTTSPAGLATKVTYNGSETVPTSVGIYGVIATVTDPNYRGATVGILVVGVAPLRITSQPASATISAGQTATFTVVATGTGPISYQWRKGSKNIAGATNATFSIPNAKISDSGSYSVIVSNKNTTLTSSSATLTVK